MMRPHSLNEWYGIILMLYHDVSFSFRWEYRMASEIQPIIARPSNGADDDEGIEPTKTMNKRYKIQGNIPVNECKQSDTQFPSAFRPESLFDSTATRVSTQKAVHGHLHG
jgi:hypothetical protein